MPEPDLNVLERSELRWMRKMVDQLSVDADTEKRGRARAEAEATTLREQLAASHAALAPLVAAARSPEIEGLSGTDGVTVSVGDCHRALAAVTEATPVSPGDNETIPGLETTPGLRTTPGLDSNDTVIVAFMKWARDRGLNLEMRSCVYPLFTDPMTNRAYSIWRDSAAFYGGPRADVAPVVTPAVTGTQEFILRAMASNYKDGHSWDHLDGTACLAAANEIRALRETSSERLDPVIAEIAIERRRQVERGWTARHDDRHRDGEIARAAASYAYSAGRLPDDRRINSVPTSWPWSTLDWRASTPRRELVKSAALAVAEIERLDRIKRLGLLQGSSTGEEPE